MPLQLLILTQWLLKREIIQELTELKLPWYEDGFKDLCNARDMRNEQYAVLSQYIGNLINVSKV